MYLLGQFCTIDVLENVYFGIGLVGSKIQYGIIFWGYTYSNLIQPVFNIQKNN